jgi:lipopolysaccharide transport system ATP-binding protein
MSAISIRSISKHYPVDNGNGQKWALKDIDLEIEKGRSVGVIGDNGAGKSTLLKILSGITYPSSGEAFINGTFSSLIEVGTGFHPDLSGRDNIYLNGSVIGLSRKEIKAQEEQIIAFSGVSEQIDEPLRTYSTGMRLRLAFAVLAHLSTDILALDEVLAVGDTQFQLRCMERIFSMKEHGRTMLFVSHNLAAVGQLCDEVAVLDKGRIMFHGPTKEAIAFYLERDRKTAQHQPRFQYIRSLETTSSETDAVVNIGFHSLPTDSELDIGLNIIDMAGNALFHFSNRFIDQKIAPVHGATIIEFRFTHCLKPGNYPIHVYLGQNEEQLEWAERAEVLVVPAYNPYGFHNPEAIQASMTIPFDIIQR